MIFSHSPKACGPLVGTMNVPSDKSIVHRAIMFAGVAGGISRIRARTIGRDNMGTARVMSALGVPVDILLPSSMVQMAREEGLSAAERKSSEMSEIVVHGAGFSGLRTPKGELYCGNSGTTARLVLGILATRSFPATLTGDESLSRRPFRRITEPLGQMGASFSGEKLPLTVRGGMLHGIEYNSPKASAQVKSAILLAGLQTKEGVAVREPYLSRDHTERMLRAMGCNIIVRPTGDGRSESLLQPPLGDLLPLDLEVPGDLSAAAFFVVLASVVPGSEIMIKDVGVNPARTGILDILGRMGASIKLLNERTYGGELVADIKVTSASLRGVVLSAQDVVRAIDEIPALAVAAALSEGVMEISHAAELRVKETDRISAMAAMLRDFGAKVDEKPDGMTIAGGLKETRLPHGGEWENTSDHRISMCGALLRCITEGHVILTDENIVETSFPFFRETLEQLLSGSVTRKRGDEAA